MIQENTAVVIDFPVESEKQEKKKFEPSEKQKKLLEFITDHLDRWRTWRDQNYMKDYEKYERIFRGVWAQEDKYRESERSRVISPATQQAIETRHAEIMEAIFGQGEFFDIKDDLADKNSHDVEQLKNQLYEDFKKDKIRKSIDQIGLLAEIYGTGIGEIVVGKEKNYVPTTMQISATENAYGVSEKERVYVRLNPVNPKNFLFDPNGTSVNDCLGVAIERYVSIHKIAAGVASGKYYNVDIDTYFESDQHEPTQEAIQFKDDKVLLCTYYGLVPGELLSDGKKEIDEEEKYDDMVEAIIIIANNKLLKAVESPYMMKDRPVISYQADTVPNRLLGRGSAEKAYNMQVSIDSQMRSHLDALALTTSPMMGLDATRLPRGAKFEVKPGKNFFVNGNPSEILFPFKFGTDSGAAMETSKEFERMLLMATGTLDSQGMITQGSRDAGGLAPAVAGIIKKYKRVLVNFQEDFLIPFIYKAAWRFMQYDPERYPAVDVKFCPTAALGILAREYEQQQMAFLMQTLGGNSPVTPILMEGILQNSSIANREQMIEQMKKLSQPDPQMQQLQMQNAQMDMQLKQAQIAEITARAQSSQAEAQKKTVEAQYVPETIQAEVNKIAAQSQLESQKAEAALRQEAVRSANDIEIERQQAIADIETKKYEAELKAHTDMLIEQQRRETQLEIERIRTEKELLLKQMESENKSPDAIQEMLARQTALLEKLTRPKKVIRDENGKVQGVE